MTDKTCMILSISFNFEYSKKNCIDTKTKYVTNKAISISKGLQCIYIVKTTKYIAFPQEMQTENNVNSKDLYAK